ncbi:MAG: penicillin-binding protein 2 [Thermoleophilia bacterium]|nr:penicillin-binding protein 2 [Thermoleophilia bacterium]
MNRQITRLAVVAIVLLTALIVATTYWQAWAAPSLAERQDNALQRVAEFRIKRGRILAADGRTVLASNVKRRSNGQTVYLRRYPTRGLFAHVVGYSTQVRSRAGLEQALNDFLTGANTNLDTVLDTTFDKLRGATIEGNDVVLTLRPRAQRVAYEAMVGQCGSVVALEPATGRVLVMASVPTYDPNLVERNYGAIARRGTPCRAGAPLVNRATQGLYAPGSTFKVVTAAAALDSGRFELDSTFNDPGYCIEYGDRVNNYDTTRPFGTVNFLQAMQYSINSVFCNVGIRMTALPIIEYMERFGFYGLPPLDTPDGERKASGLYEGGKLFRPKDPNQVDPGRLAFGQERLGVTPLQMAMVAAAIANSGAVMRPQLVQRVQAPDGKRITRLRPDELNRAVSRKTAEDVTRMMEAVVQNGTGTAAQLPGVSVAGKTGTAETGVAGRNNAWFLAFAPSDKPRIAIAVVVENTNGTGGQVAAPIAKRVLQALMPAASNSVPSG